MTYLEQSRAQNAAFNKSRADDRHTTKQWLLYGAAAFTLGFILVPMMLSPIAPPAVFDLVQYNGDESDIIDYDLSSTDCALAEKHLRRAGHDVACEATAR